MKWLFIAFVCILQSLCAEIPIVFIHLGRTLPVYYSQAIEQAHLFNPDSPIYVIVHAQAVPVIVRKKRLPEYTKLIVAQDLPVSDAHKTFARTSYQSITDTMSRFWRYSMERFFILEEFMDAYNLEELFHLEGDNLLYANLDTYQPTLHEGYIGLGVPFLNDTECVAGIMYVQNKRALHVFTEMMNTILQKGGRENDMSLLATFSKQTGLLHPLPCVPTSYAEQEEMVSLNGECSENPTRYAYYSEPLGALFDAAPLGQLLDGDSMLQGKNRKPSIVNPCAMYDSRKLPLSWGTDSLNRTVPCITYDGRVWPVINLHIHSKNLYKFVEQ